jgi:DNA-binding FadR family transcriptional regulator
MLQKPKHNRIFHDLVAQIETAILEDKLKPGEKLPSERGLQEMFETSRSSIREALRVLEQKGLIEIKLGPAGGARVKPASADCVVETLALLIKRKKVSLNDLAEFREGVEGNVAALAAERAGRTDIRNLKELLIVAKAQLDQGLSNWEKFIQVDRDLHIAIAKIADNPVYRFVLDMVQQNIISYYKSFPLRSEEMMEENFQDLFELVRKIEQGNAEEARLIIQRHIRKFNRYMKIESNSSELKAVDLKGNEL